MQKVKGKIIQIIAFSKSSKIAFILISEIFLGLLLTLTTLTIFFKLGHEVLETDTFIFDTKIINTVYYFRNPIMTFIMQGFTFLGGEIFLGIAIVSTIVFIYNRHKKDALLFACTLIFGVLLNLFLKNMFHRPRPTFLPLVHEQTFSFPSGHAMNSFVFYTCLSYFVFRKMKNEKMKRLCIALSITLIFCIGLSRVYLGVHFPSDVFAGYIAGLCWFVLVLLFEKTVLFFHLLRGHENNKY